MCFLSIKTLCSQYVLSAQCRADVIPLWFLTVRADSYALMKLHCGLFSQPERKASKDDVWITTALQTVLTLLSLWQDPQSCWLSCSWWFLNAPDYIFEDADVNLSSQVNKTVSLTHIHTLQVFCTEAESKQM